jgi:hypothetical protein
MAKKNDHFWRSGQGIVAGLFIAAVSYFLLIEHRQHLFEYLPYLILLACPLMHVFMHGGHGHGKHQHDDDKESSEPLSFEQKQQKNSDYRDGYIEGIKVAREEKKGKNKEKDDAR